MDTPSHRGLFVVFEGLDRSGKSTQSARLVRNLKDQGHQVRHISFPDRTTPIGQMINSYLKGQSQQEDHVIHLLFSANRWEAAESISHDIASGTTIVCDRYYYSGCVYSAAKENPSLSLEWARRPEEGLPRPDVCLFLDISPEKAAERGGFGHERYEQSEMQKRVRELFLRLRSSPDENDFVTVDAGQPADVVEKEVLQIVVKTRESIDAHRSSLRSVHA
ncbi:thymidylate kinase [Viridothelium virens]|uniref:Thymidylate kinase n=1 Tax=Viridothelium virens TaxID=1048519 RepID=A0A6A6HHG9_VIRVR|nr:thymidylate kinase [Viridothelium virens]